MRLCQALGNKSKAVKMRNAIDESENIENCTILMVKVLIAFLIWHYSSCIISRVFSLVEDQTPDLNTLSSRRILGRKRV